VHVSQDGVTRSRKRPATRSLPDWALSPEASLFLNIPMDAETPSMRLLRPQALVQEEAIRYWATTTAYRCGYHCKWLKVTCYKHVVSDNQEGTGARDCHFLRGKHHCIYLQQAVGC
jgi:hypothetical protein